MIEVKEYLMAVQEEIDGDRSIRLGQSLFNNAKMMVHKERVNETIVGEEYDPFYDDSRIPQFLELVLPSGEFEKCSFNKDGNGNVMLISYEEILVMV